MKEGAKYVSHGATGKVRGCLFIYSWQLIIFLVYQSLHNKHVFMETFLAVVSLCYLGNFIHFEITLFLQGNDQIRFELTYYALYPGVTVSARPSYAVMKLQKSVK